MLPLPDKQQNKIEFKKPTIENINTCFLELKKIIDTHDPNGEWYAYENKFGQEFRKCLFRLKAENIIELNGSNFKLSGLGYEVYNAGNYFDYTFKKDILYFVLDAMKGEGNTLNFENLLNKLKPETKQIQLKNIFSTTAVQISIKSLYDLLIKEFENLKD